MRSALATCLFIGLALLPVRNVQAEVACQSEFSAAMGTIDSASLSQGNAQKIATKVRNAWRMYASASQNGAANAVKELKKADDLIDGASMTGVSSETRQTIKTSIGAFRACLTSAPPVQTTTLTVKVLAVQAEGETPQPAGANAIVTVAGVTSKTKGDSTASLTVAIGSYSVEAQLGNSAGWTKVDLVAGTPAQAQVILLPNRDTATAVLLSANEIVDGVLPRDFAALTLRLENDLGEAISVDRIEQVEIAVAQTERRVVTPMFRASGGAIALTDRASLAAFLLERIDPFELRVRALDKAGIVYNAMLKFAIGRFRPTAAISGPGNISGANVPLLITHDRTGFSFWATSGANGAASFPLLPDGTYLVSCETVQSGERWYGTGGFVLNGDKTFNVSLFSMRAPDPIAESIGQITAAAASSPSAGGEVTSNAPRPAIWNGQRVAAISAVTTGDGGLIEPRALDILDWPQRLENTTDEEIEAAEGWLIEMPDERDPSDRRPVFIRALDASGKEILRQVLIVEVFSLHERARQAVAPARWPRHAVVSFQAVVPFPETRTIEIRGWRPGQVVRWEIDELRQDPQVMQGVFVRKDR